MSAHLHRVFVPGCFRCDLSRDEVSMTAVDLDAVEARWRDWYGSDDMTPDGTADWSELDSDETLSHFIVREDVPALVAELREARAKLAAIDTFGTNLVITVNDYSAKLRAIDAFHQELFNDADESLDECAGCGGLSFPCETRKILDGTS